MFGEKLKELRKSRALSMEDLAAQYNTRFLGKLNKSTLSRYENNLQEPMINVVKNLAEFFNVPIGILTGEAHEDFDIFSIPGIMPLPKTYKVPRLGKIACGEPLMVEENFEGYDDVAESIKCDFSLVCDGDSMINARINDGDIVYIRQQSIVDNGSIAAVMVDGATTLKRVYLFKNKIILQAENPKYEPWVYVNEELENILILGKAVGFTSIIR